MQKGKESKGGTWTCRRGKKNNGGTWHMDMQKGWENDGGTWTCRKGVKIMVADGYVERAKKIMSAHGHVEGVKIMVAHGSVGGVHKTHQNHGGAW